MIIYNVTAKATKFSRKFEDGEVIKQRTPEYYIDYKKAVKAAEKVTQSSFRWSKPHAGMYVGHIEEINVDDYRVIELLIDNNILRKG